jgi:hypothetical protein
MVAKIGFSHQGESELRCLRRGCKGKCLVVEKGGRRKLPNKELQNSYYA